MKRITVGFLLGALLAVALPAAPAAASFQGPHEVAFLKHLNAERQKIGKGPLLMHTGLRLDATRPHSRYMFQQGGISHDNFVARFNSSRSDPPQAGGPPDPGFTGSACENVAMFTNPNLTTPNQVAQQFYSQWFNSPPHRECMHDENNVGHNVAGIGIFQRPTGTWWATLMLAVDNTPPNTQTWKRRQATHASLNYTGNWFTVNNMNATGGVFTRSVQKGAKVSFTFNGTGVRWLSLTDPKGGRARVRIDGQNMGVIDLYSPSRQWRQFVHRTTGLPNQQHTFEIVVLRSKRATSSGFNVYVDAIDFLS